MFLPLPLAAVLALGFTNNPSPQEMRDLQADTWVATDALGRTLPGFEECGPPQADRTVGIFYFLWLGAHGQRGPYDIARLRAEKPDDPAWGPPGAFHHWGEPELGYYLSDDPFVYRRHAALLSAAGVDVVIFDVTNGPTYDRQLETLARTWLQVRAEGNPTPAFAFLAHTGQERVVTHLYETLYAPGQFRPLWFHWRGKPLMMASPEGLADAVADFFTFRESWAWTHTEWFGDGKGKWPWLDHTPQRPGLAEDGTPEQVAVAVAEHPISNIGRSHHGGRQPSSERLQTDRGLYFQEQWERALELDPPFVFLTGWNEWVAQRFVKAPGEGPPHMAGVTLNPGDTYFVDQYSQEFSRDIEPMRGGHGDSYYYQMVANIRRFKGVRPLPRPGPPRTIAIDGDFTDWDDVTPEYRDAISDTAHRDHPGWGAAGPYVDRAGRNDFVTLKVADDEEFVAFYAETREPISPPGEPDWMLLLIDVDGDIATGSRGYDLVVNRSVVRPGLTEVHALAADGSPTPVERVPFAVSGNKLELRLPRRLLADRDGGLSFDFHWADGIARDRPDAGYFTSADDAPERRFNYRYHRAD